MIASLIRKAASLPMMLACDYGGIQKAIDAAPIGGLVFIDGDYGVTDPIKITKPLHLRGSATDIVGPSILWGDGEHDVIQILSPGVSLKRICIRNQNPLAGAGIRISPGPSNNGSGTCPVRLAEIWMCNVFDGIVVEGGNLVMIDRGQITSAIRDGVRMTGGLSVEIRSLNTLSCAATGYNLISGAACWMNACQSWGDFVGVRVAGLQQFFPKQVVADMSTSDAWTVDCNSSMIDCTACWARGSHTGYGINLALTNGFSWRGGFIGANYLGGVRIGIKARNCLISETKISANSLNNPIRGVGVLADPGASFFQLFGNMLGKDSGDPAGVQETGMFIPPGISDHYKIIGNLNTDPDHQKLIVDGGTGTNKLVLDT